MARPMNLEKRVKALAEIVNRSMAHCDRATRIAEELTNSFKNTKTPEGKKAQKTAKAATLVATRLALVSRKLTF